MAKKVNINNNQFDKSRINIGQGQHIKFKSIDGKTYVVDCGKSDPDISDDFPFTVPGDNSEHKLKIKDKAKKQDYVCSITSNGSKSTVRNVESPTMIIKVE